MHIEFTKAEERHTQMIVDLVNSAYRGESSKLGWTTEADLLDGQRTDAEGILAQLRKNDSVILIAEDEESESMVGCLHLEKQDLTCVIGMFTVSPELQGMGIGKMLLGEAEAMAQYWDCKTLSMTVISKRTELLNWYQKLGFKQTGAKKPFPYGDARFGIPKVADLEFVVLEKNI